MLRPRETPESRHSRVQTRQGRIKLRRCEAHQTNPFKQARTSAQLAGGGRLSSHAQSPSDKITWVPKAWLALRQSIVMPENQAPRRRTASYIVMVSSPRCRLGQIMVLA